MLHTSAATAPKAPAETDEVGHAVPPRRRRGSWLGWSAAASALAAAVLVMVLWPGRDFEPLPPYTAKLAGGIQEMRGQVDKIPEAPPWSAVSYTFASGNTFDLVLRPDRDVSEPVAVEAFLLHGSELSEWPVPVERAPTGAARIVGEVGRGIQLPPGESTLLIALGRPGSAPPGHELRDRLEGIHQFSTAHWVAWKLKVDLKSP